ncbi:hypothetical protein COCHEDRAFT_1181542 [Bipolaris maydis C5]|uniref:Uncharacterized protein n=2 Tax=Cochliobolus heterostrophus TaxID=5016 RepID=M2ST22_COCH5|nr:hypothetical protein COCHEDRAFT_1181542 [Bipolaris maydis C5]
MYHSTKHDDKIHPYFISVTSSRAILPIPYILGMSIMFVIAAVARRPAILQIVRLGGMAITWPLPRGDDLYLT